MEIADSADSGLTGSAYTLSALDRRRWNLLDAVTVVAKGSIPCTLFSEVNMGWAEKLREQFAAKNCKLTVTAILLKAIGTAQSRYPLSGGVIMPGGRIATFDDITAGFTVERFVQQKPVLFFGTIKKPNEKSLPQIMTELYAYSQESVDEHPVLKIQEHFSQMPWLVRQLILWVGMRFPQVRQKYIGATFGLTSLGKYGIKTGTGPTICAANFAVGVVEQRLVADKGIAIIQPMMTLSLFFDRRVINEAQAAKLQQEVVSLIEGRLNKCLEDDERLQDSNVHFHTRKSHQRSA